MRTEATLLCALECDARERALVACARRWAHATRSRLLFVHAGGADLRSDPAATPDVGVASHELRRLAGEPEAAVVEAIAEERPWLALLASSSPATQAVCGAVLRHASAPVGMLPPAAACSDASEGPIVCAVSLGANDEAAVRFASTLATTSRRALVLEPVLGPRDAVLEAASRARGSVLVGRDRERGRPVGRGVAEGAAPHAVPGAPDDAARADALAGRLVDVAGRMGASMLVLAARAADGGGDVAAQVARRLRTAAPCLVVTVRP